jgi:hypothetical protein
MKIRHRQIELANGLGRHRRWRERAADEKPGCRGPEGDKGDEAGPPAGASAIERHGLDRGLRIRQDDPRFADRLEPPPRIALETTENQTSDGSRSR